jgi:hypothetical protein
MDINELLEEAKDEPASVIARSGDGRLFFIPDADAKRFELEDSDLYKTFVARRGGAPSGKVESLYPCGLVRNWLDSHRPSVK